MARKPGWIHWLMLALAGVLLFLVATRVDLRPVVDENFFFSASDPSFQQAKKIEEHFPSRPEVILAVSGDISSAHYLSRIQRLTQRVEAIDTVTPVKSVTAGPKSFQDALASPFWSRLLIAKDRKATNVTSSFKPEKIRKSRSRNWSASSMSSRQRIFEYTSPVRLTWWK